MTANVPSEDASEDDDEPTSGAEDEPAETERIEQRDDGGGRDSSESESIAASILRLRMR